MTRFLLAIACLMSAATVQAQVYKCVDARGVTHYSDGPRPDCKGVEVNIRAQPPISGKLDDYGSNLPDAERDFRKRQSQRDREGQDQAKADADLKARCAKVKADYQYFTSLRRIATVGPDGERIYMDAAERDARTAAMEAEIARTCK